ADQDLIILDEPTGGLDPLIQQELWRIFKEEVDYGKTIFMSSHILAEVEAVCDRVAIIRDGILQVEERISKLQDKMGKILEVEFREPVDRKIFKIPGVNNIETDGTKLTMTIHDNLDDVIKRLSDYNIVNMSLKTYSLEQLFLRYYSGDEEIEKVGGE
ncbi:ABC transporter ATP-binding protein, partial [bacterium]|nr:ABC transporter ATP-binding protein [bacterium]